MCTSLGLLKEKILIDMDRKTVSENSPCHLTPLLATLVNPPKNNPSSFQRHLSSCGGCGGYGELKTLEENMSGLGGQGLTEEYSSLADQVR